MVPAGEVWPAVDALDLDVEHVEAFGFGVAVALLGFAVDRGPEAADAASEGQLGQVDDVWLAVEEVVPLLLG